MADNDIQLAQQPVRGVHISAPLSSLSLGYHPVGMVAERIAPVVPVAHENDLYYVWSQADALREVDSLRADGAEASIVDFGWSQNAYVALEFALKHMITDRQRKNADDALQLEISKLRRTQDLVLVGQERRVSNLMTTSSLPAANRTTLSGVNQWNNASFAGSIEQNIDTGDEAIRQQIGGLPPNVILIPKAVSKVVKRDSKVRDLIKYTHQDLLVDGELPGKLWNKEVIIPSVSTTTSIENPSVAPTMADIWGKNVYILYRTETPGLDTLSALFIFRARPWQVKVWRQEDIDSTFYQPSILQAEALVSSLAAYLISAAIA